MKNSLFRFSTVRLKLVGSILLLTVPALLLMYIYRLPFSGFVVGLLALAAAWMGGEYFVRRQAQALSQTARKIAGGDLSARSGLKASGDELGQLAMSFDRMAEVLEQRIKEREQLATFAELNPYAAMEFAADGKMNYSNGAARKLALALNRKQPSEILPENIGDIIRDCLATGQSRLGVQTTLNWRTLSWSFHPMAASHAVHCYVEDITDRLNLEARLRHSQRMEPIGQLAAGVAHDFNNLLTIIQGHSTSLLAQTSLPAKVGDPVQAIYFAAERAAGLTRQLLMFSRKNVMQPKQLDLREILGNLTKMLQRLIGETIKLQFTSPSEIPLVQGDAGMIEQVVMNLTVNARDAMPQGGTLSIGIEPVTIDVSYTKMHPEARAGRFLRLRVADTGTGMDSTTLNRIFEPFFTTKDIGKGTGLGLATVYGIVKQHEGWMEVYSELGKGSTFDVFFPAGESKAESKAADSKSEAPVAGGTETILVVEDEEILREMTRGILAGCGYRVLEASSGKSALQVWRKSAREVDLLITDMTMPEGISGVDLAERLLADRPDLKIIFSSGYSTSEVGEELLMKSQARFLPKPYTRHALAKTVRECLDKNFAGPGNRIP